MPLSVDAVAGAGAMAVAVMSLAAAFGEVKVTVGVDLLRRRRLWNHSKERSTSSQLCGRSSAFLASSLHTNSARSRLILLFSWFRFGTGFSTCMRMTACGSVPG